MAAYKYNILHLPHLSLPSHPTVGARELRKGRQKQLQKHSKSESGDKSALRGSQRPRADNIKVKLVSLHTHREKYAELSRHKQHCIDVCVEVDVTCEHVGSGELNMEERGRDRGEM